MNCKLLQPFEYGFNGFMMAPLLVQVVPVAAEDFTNMEEMTKESDFECEWMMLLRIGWHLGMICRLCT